MVLSANEMPRLDLAMDCSNDDAKAGMYKLDQTLMQLRAALHTVSLYSTSTLKGYFIVLYLNPTSPQDHLYFMSQFNPTLYYGRYRH